MHHAETVLILLLVSVVVLVIAFTLDRTIAWTIYGLNRLCRSCRDSISANDIPSSATSQHHKRSAELREMVDQLQSHETLVSQAFATSSCSQADLLRAASMRLQAEIALFRHERMPRPFA